MSVVTRRGNRYAPARICSLAGLVFCLAGTANAAPFCAGLRLCDKTVEAAHSVLIDGKERLSSARFYFAADGSMSIIRFLGKPTITRCTSAGRTVTRSCPGKDCSDFPSDGSDMTYKLKDKNFCRVSYAQGVVDIALSTTSDLHATRFINENGQRLEETGTLTTDAHYTLQIILAKNQCVLTGKGLQDQKRVVSGSYYAMHPERIPKPEPRAATAALQSLKCEIVPGKSEP